MAKWDVTGMVAGTKHLGAFEAETGMEAIEKAKGCAHIGLCRQCDSECANATIEYMTAECGDELVTTEETWKDKARAAGWGPMPKGEEQTMTEKQQALLDRLRAKPAGLYLQGVDVRVCRALVKKGLAKLEDYGAMRGDNGRSDGARWRAEVVPCQGTER